ncbi:hypothetical protein ACTFIW_013344 [Dictyostelium discoideum]
MILKKKIRLQNEIDEENITKEEFLENNLIREYNHSRYLITKLKKKDCVHFEKLRFNFNEKQRNQLLELDKLFQQRHISQDEQELMKTSPPSPPSPPKTTTTTTTTTTNFTIQHEKEEENNEEENENEEIVVMKKKRRK